MSGRDCQIKMILKDNKTKGEYISDDTLRDEIAHSDCIMIGLKEVDKNDGEAIIKLRKTKNGMFMDVRTDMIDDVLKKAYLNDYDEIDEDGNWLQINASSTIPMRKLKDLIRIIDTGSVKKQKAKKSEEDNAA